MEVATEEPPVVSFLKPGFTAIPNAFWDLGVIQKLKPSELTLLLVLWRFISGYLKTGAIIGEGFLLGQTKLSLATLYSAKRALCEFGYIIISHTKGGRCYYQLAPFLQAVRTGEEIAATALAKGSAPLPSGPPEGGPSGPSEGSLYKEKKENLDQHHCPQPDPSPVSNGDDESSISSKETRTNKNHALANQLKALGVNEFIAHKLIKSHTEEVVTQALSRLKHVSVENPAGYLVSEITRGGYGNLKPDKTVAIRKEHEKIHEQRRTERELEKQAKEESSERVAKLIDQFEKLPADRQRELRAQLNQQAHQEGFTRLPGWSESSPAYRGLLAEIVARALAQDELLCRRE